MAQHRFIDPKALARLKNTALRARAVADGILQGLHQSPHQGASIEFSEHKEYAPGDAIKHVDWRVYGRLDKYYVKKFEHETSLEAWLAIDSSASMGYAHEGSMSKYDYAATLASAIAYLLLKQQDAVGLIRFADKVKDNIPPKSRMSHLGLLAKRLEDAKVGKGTDMAEALMNLSLRAKKRGLILLFSDFFDQTDEAFKRLARLSSQGHDVTVVHVLDQDELEFPFQDMSLFEGLESNARLLVEPSLVRKEYLKRMKAHQEEVKEKAYLAEAYYLLADTRVPPGELILKWLLARQNHSQGGRR